ncbi:YceI family protein [Leifsonia aquatica]|uniref:YceI family protein n=1 Tax=Leifsonia aquatica TaxID=144185 RepID=UPI000AA5B0C4
MSPMKKSSKIWISVAAGVVVLGVAGAIAAPYVYRDLIAAPADAVPTIALTTDPDAKTTIDTSDLSGDWQVGASSYAGYRVDEVLNGVNVTVTGRTADVAGSFTVDTLTLTKATVTVKVGTIATDEPNRDDYFRSTALQTDRYPEATFVLADPISVSAPAAGTAQTVTATGTLTLHGVSKAVTADLQVGLNGNGGQLSGSIPITFADYGVTAPSLGFVTVEKTGSIEFLLNLKKAAG